LTINDKRAQEKPEPKKRRGCFFWGCLTTFGIVVVIALVLSITVFKVPQKIGLVKPATERLLSKTPDRETALKIKADIQKAGISTNGVDLYVVPKKNSNASILFTILDASKGFYFSGSSSGDPISDYLVKLAKSSQSYGIERVTFEYRDSSGNTVADVTAPVDTILKYSSGQMNKTDFYNAIDAKLNLNEVINQGLP
jgi:hypothetical protein